jgi:hypothetical protein
MNLKRVIVIGGGPAGVFAAIACAEAATGGTDLAGKMPAPPASGAGVEVTVLERSARFLTKVRISGGGRCNVTHACFDDREFATRYPRGGKALLSPFKSFQASDTVAWFEARGVKLKTEADGRMFPTSNSSETVVNCLLHSARAAGVKLRPNAGVKRITRLPDGRFEVELEPQSQAGSDAPASGSCGQAEPGAPVETLTCDRLLLATGGCRAAAAGQLAVSLGHSLEPPVPSLFTFQISTPWLRGLAGVSVGSAEVSVPGARLRERGALLVTHWGLSGPAILRLSAWGARALHEVNCRFPLQVNWLPQLHADAIGAELKTRRTAQPARLVVNVPVTPLPSRLWEQLVLAAGIARDTRWAALSQAAQHRLVQQLIRTEFPVTGKSLNKDEFVTCGGVRLSEVNFKTMESRICPGLYFAGELLDIDGITGGFNFQAAWTTGWLAGRALAAG